MASNVIDQNHLFGVKNGEELLKRHRECWIEQKERKK